MISLKRFLPEKESDAQLLPVVKLLLDCIAVHSVEGDPEDHTRFREGIGHIKEQIDKENTPSELLALADSAVRAFDVYNRRTSKYLGLRSAEFLSMVKMLISKISAITVGNETGVRLLQEIDKQLDAAILIDDVRQIASRLSECLDGFQREAGCQVTGGAQELTLVPASVTAATRLVDVDSVTGLPSRKPAVEALTRACQGDEQAYVLILVVNRIQVLNTRFSFEVGDEILRHFANFIKRELISTDLVFRWTGPILVAILFRKDSFAKVRDDIGPRMDVKYEHTIQTAARTIMLPISTRWTVFPMMASPRMLTQKIDGFGSFESSHD